MISLSVKAIKLAIALFSSTGMAGASALRHAAGRLQSNPGTINAPNAAGFSAPPSNEAPWTSFSYIPIQGSGTAPQTAWISVSSRSGSGVLHLYTSLDGQTNLVQDDDNVIVRTDTHVPGAINARVSAIYRVDLPAGVSYLAASSWSGGSVLVFAVAGPSTYPEPAYTTVYPNPLSIALADVGGAGDTIGIEFVDATGATIPFADSNGVLWSALTVTVGISAKAGLAYLVLSTMPDGTHPIVALPVGAAAVRLRCLTGTSGVPTLAINTGGLTTGVAGTGGTGYNTGNAPGPSSPIQFYVGDADTYGRAK